MGRRTPSAGIAPPTRTWLFPVVVAALLVLAAAPFWRTHLLPMQDYPQMLALARAYGDCQVPSSPFYGTYERGFALGPLFLTIAALRGIGALVGLETAGRVLWTLSVVALPLAALDLIRVLGRDRWTVLLVFPLVCTYWVAGGFFAFATAAPLLVLGLSFAVRWLTFRAPRHGAAFAAIACVLELWHALVLAQLAFAFCVLWALRSYRRPRERIVAAIPLVPSVALFALWLVLAVLRRSPGSHSPTWSPLLENASHFFDYVGPIGALGTGGTILLLLLVASLLLVKRESPPVEGFRIANPFGLVAFMVALTYFVLPATCFGVEGIANRQPWFAALLAVFAIGTPTSRHARIAWLTSIGAAAAGVLFTMGQRFAAFDKESLGASRLIDQVEPDATLLAPMGTGATLTFPTPAKPLSTVELYATIRHGTLPDTSFAGYDTNIVRYADGKNPMPGLRNAWRGHIDELRSYDYVLLRVPISPEPPTELRLKAIDGDFRLYAVCGSRHRPECY